MMENCVTIVCQYTSSERNLRQPFNIELDIIDNTIKVYMLGKRGINQSCIPSHAISGFELLVSSVSGNT